MAGSRRRRMNPNCPARSSVRTRYRDKAAGAGIQHRRWQALELFDERSNRNRRGVDPPRS